ncbi:MAG: type II secretion system F family protein, partial [Planctomycetota bacterium]|nr:type II secretion system F family protein [Planctomycetota bacterium]
LMVVGITFFLLVFVIPKFEDMFTSLNVELPGITTALLSASLFLRENFLLWGGGVVGVGIALTYWMRSESGMNARDWLLIKIPVFGPLFKKVTLSRFSRTLSTLVQSGVPILGALEIVSQTCGNRVFARAIEQAADSVREGEPLGEPLGKSGVFPPMVSRMVTIGERTGALEGLLEKIADFYDRQVRTSVEGLTSMIEPFMIGIMGFLVGGMVMAIFLPIFKMVGSMNGG